MSKGTILEDLGEGQYRVSLGLDQAKALERRQALEDEISRLSDSVTELLSEYNDVKSELTLAATLLTNAIQAKDPKMIADAEKVWIEKVEATERAKGQLEIEKVRKFSAEKRLTFLNNQITDTADIVTIWCADYTEGLTGDVGLIDLNATAVIQPGWNPSPTPESFYDPARDGVMTPAASFVSGAGLYRALALYDGWQLFKPTYRTGVITAISGDTCSVNLDNLQTRYIGADANREMDYLSNIEIDYMDCDGAVFGVGDHVVVAFINQNPDVARVVGFVANPLPCILRGVLATYGLPNGGSADRANFLFMHSNEDGWIGRQYNADISGGSMQWLGPKNASNEYDKYVVMRGARDTPTSFGVDLMQNGKVVATAPRPIMGGAIANVSGTDYFVIVILDNDDMWQATADVFLKRPVDDPLAAWVEIGQVPHSAYGLDATYHHLFPNPESTAYLFSESGKKAIKLQRVAKVPDPAHPWVDNPDWETEVPITSSPAEPNQSGLATHVLEAWMARNQYEDSPIRRQAFVVEVVLAGDLSGLTYTIDEDVPTITETGTRPEDWEDGSLLSHPSYQEHEVTSTSLHAVDYIGETKTQLSIEHTATRSLTMVLQESEFSGAPFADVIESTTLRTSETIFKQDGAEIFRCNHNSNNYLANPSSWVADWSMIHLLSDLLAIDLRFGLVVVREIDVDLSETWQVEGDTTATKGKSGTQTIDYTESIVVKSATSADVVIASESITDTLETPKILGDVASPTAPFDRVLGYQDLQTGLGEVVVSPGSNSWPEFAGKPLIGYAFSGALGADTVKGGAAIYTAKTGEIFVGGLAQSRSISRDTDQIEWGEKPYPEVSVFPLSDGNISDAMIVARGKTISGAWVEDPGADAANYADITSGWLYLGAIVV